MPCITSILFPVGKVLNSEFKLKDTSEPVHNLVLGGLWFFATNFYNDERG